MGQEIRITAYSDGDYRRFHGRLAAETELLAEMVGQRAVSEAAPVAGFELEAWLLHDDMLPAALNEAYLNSFNNPMAGPELAKFNIELNTPPLALTANALAVLHQNLAATWRQAEQHARRMELHLLMIGTLPTLRQSQLNLENMSNMNRYRELNRQVLKNRGKPIQLDICGQEHLRLEHHDVMLEAATTSFQLHLQCPLSVAHHVYNASMLASAAMVAVCANAPYLFGRDLWAETRIPMFEQAVALGGYSGAAEGPLHRVSFGSDYARLSILECFEENLRHFPVLLPEYFDDDAAAFSHLRLHNGTIWRWNRPLVGFDADGMPHIRIEHRVPAAGPTVLDAIANAAFFYGLVSNLARQRAEGQADLPFSQAKDNFYQAARHGLDSHVVWLGGNRQRLAVLVRNELLPLAHAGLLSLGIDVNDANIYLDVLEQRLANRQTGSDWQRRFIQQHPGDFAGLTRQYLRRQRRGEPVAGWDCAI
ncbi:glutamate-cysteine ligase family protein [Methylomonas sp. SURF-2]|uniref:Glutamate-cysteine ligase family protein n=1 Tax=Methylomonas subterranea TaxID=2952225 RepID=A0ABT1TKT4_9GAMM|nr:glutamate-cysteine ligase family protein [Methylomonas sp. SURF-2]MCQ8106086.1 glutamate-cysteine ligase family protein [Methylomonas sp. SURF-2]